MPNNKAGEGEVYVCTACGKTASWKWGFDDEGRRAAMDGWDESCAMNSIRVKKTDIKTQTDSGRVTKLCEGTVDLDGQPDRATG